MPTMEAEEVPYAGGYSGAEKGCYIGGDIAVARYHMGPHPAQWVRGGQRGCAQRLQAYPYTSLRSICPVIPRTPRTPYIEIFRKDGDVGRRGPAPARAGPPVAREGVRGAGGVRRHQTGMSLGRYVWSIRLYSGRPPWGGWRGVRRGLAASAFAPIPMALQPHPSSAQILPCTEYCAEFIARGFILSVKSKG
jgi:hypothetical protein